MKRFVEGEDRRQGVLRVIEAFANELDLQGLGFEGVVPEATGRPV